VRWIASVTSQLEERNFYGSLLFVAMEMLWNGDPLRLWVTDEHNGAGGTLLALRVVRE
jgi:hypothetical protein